MGGKQESKLLVGAKAFARSLIPIGLALLALYHKGLLPVTPEGVSHQAATWIDLVEVILGGMAGKGAVSAAFAKSVVVKGS